MLNPSFVIPEKPGESYHFPTDSEDNNNTLQYIKFIDMITAMTWYSNANRGSKSYLPSYGLCRRDSIVLPIFSILLSKMFDPIFPDE